MNRLIPCRRGWAGFSAFLVMQGFCASDLMAQPGTPPPPASAYGREMSVQDPSAFGDRELPEQTLGRLPRSDAPVIPNTGIPATAPTLDDVSWIVIEKPLPRPLRIHDILTITVDDKSEMIVDNRFNRTRIAQLTAELKEFIRIKDGNLENAAGNSPTIDTALQSRLNSQGQIQSSEGIKYIVAATVVDIRPNGNLILEAKKRVRVNNDTWEYRLTGEIRPEKVNRDFTAISEDVANMYIEKNQVGKVHESTKRPWGVVLYDWLSPF